MKKKSSWIQIGIFVAFISFFFIANLIMPDRDFSEQENRYLKKKPEFAFDSLVSGKFTSDFETYTTDQFVWRDGWISMKARSELLLGKGRNNGVYLCDGKFGDTLIQSFSAPEQSVLDANVSHLNALAENSGVPVYFALIPGKSEIWSGNLPKNAPNDSEQEVIDYCYAQSAVSNIDMASALEVHGDEYIFYRTDHHWTTLGAYYGYAAIMEALGMEPRALESYSPETVSGSFYGTTWSSSGFSWVAPDNIDVYVQPFDGLSIQNYSDGTPKEGVLYDESYLEKKDKYSMFYGGNTPLLQISTGVESAPSLLIIRDSYCDSLSPFLLDSFSEIHIMDLRYYRASLSEYIAANEIDNILVMYSTSNFCTDTNLFLLGR